MKIHFRHKWAPSKTWLSWREVAAQSGYGPGATRFRDEVCECGATRIVDRKDGTQLAYRTAGENRRGTKRRRQEWSF